MRPAIRVDNLSKQYRIGTRQRAADRDLREVITEGAANLWRRLRGGNGAALDEAPPDNEFWALKDVSFEVQPGEVVGIIGRNGAGKSTLLKILSRIVEPTSGRVEIRGRMGSLLEVGTGFHPELTGRENIYLNGSILGMTRNEIDRKFDEIVAFSEIDKFLDTPVKRYSSGMYVRLAFAVAANVEPDLLIVDEVLAVGDAQFQKRCLNRMGKIASEGRTVLVVSHSMQAVRQLCTRTIVLKEGCLECDGSVGTGIAAYYGGETLEKVYHLGGLGYAGNMGAQLRTVRFLGNGNEAATTYDNADNLAAEVRFSLFRRVEAFDMSMAIVHHDGTRIFSNVLSDNVPHPTLEPGDYRVQFEFPLKYLRSDYYTLAMHIGSNDVALHMVEGIPLPDITDRNGGAFKESHRWGFVRIPVAWSDIAAE